MKRFLALVLAAALLLSGFGCVVISHVTKYANATKYTAGGFTYEADKVTRVELEWIAGGVTLKNGTGTLSVSENGGDSLAVSERLHWWLDGTTLRIKYCESGYSHVITENKKHLTLELPDGVDLKADIAAGGMDAETVTLGTLDLNNASGGVKFTALDASEVKINAASGGVHFGTLTVEDAFSVDIASGGLTAERISAKTVKVDSASGGVSLGLDEVRSVDIDAASGKVTLELLDAARGATVRLNKLSGSFDCKLPMTAEGKSYKIGNGEIQIKIDTASGGVEIK